MLAQFLAKEESIIRKNVLKMGHETSKAIEKSITCYKDLNLHLADEIIKNDAVINELEARVESECISVIARQQPVANDLRELLADMNIAKELERIADYAVSIAKIVRKLPLKEREIDPDIIEMAKKCVVMLNEIMIDYAEKDAQKASNVARLDDEIDDMQDALNHKMFEKIKETPDEAICCTYQLWIIHQLERMGDRVTNIAESVVFIATGKVVNFD
ncbi:MAG: phosphate signaling complex protein PhoU [Gammaproteobacteria bacterium]|nr:phosphate signaling complex protein PhoU [Gammaproteobacteria bacterium]